MPRFPKEEADILALAERLYAGFKDNPVLFPNPPHPPNQPGNGIRWFVLVFQARRNDLIAARAAAESAVAAKDEALENLSAALKDDLRYAENTVDFDDNKLKLLGWSGKAAKTPLAPPGQVRLAEAVKQGAGWVFLDWKQPADGGKPAAYQVQRRNAAAEPVDDRWQDVATAILSEITLVDQPQGQKLEYRIIAINKSGVGSPSNTVMAVL